MAGFTYEKNLPHQERAIESVLSVFDRVYLKHGSRDENPKIVFSDSLKADNLQKIQQMNGAWAMLRFQAAMCLILPWKRGQAKPTLTPKPCLN